MQLVQFVHQGATRCGYTEGDEIVGVDWSLRDALVLLAAGQNERITDARAARVPRSDVVLLPPVVPGSRVFCIGINYLDHQQESMDVFLATVPKAPVVFMKDLSTIAGPFDRLDLPSSVSVEFDWEAELGVVIGAPARNVSEEDSWDVVAGYTVVNDVSVRDRQIRHVQWTLGKNAPASTPVGPGIVDRDTIGINPDIEVTCRVNGVVKQNAFTRDLIFDIPRLIAEISQVTPLLPGDIIVSGTAAGVGFKRNPPEFLRDGDVVEVEIAGVGTISNRVRTEC
ncbi:fumarylacetoacetate hydrolase family protein [Mycobacterium sp. ITM-2016-00317]|uniref:fumarylacetoacetate hydrolase family protein n=1 Tax=Mycobacterium sp. ITM-2016-00317 TaxID=2099694 RepID=UPI00287F928B|nr:fumarylacetoacetate hydrolase family protein [Mycobacterium sp. ITM-2016-00317]WNG86571.1 fumarylacetoacetate hydrolase family protein [Mycobacterium sp. ITM-2016-00317]